MHWSIKTVGRRPSWCWPELGVPLAPCSLNRVRMVVRPIWRGESNNHGFALDGLLLKRQSSLRITTLAVNECSLITVLCDAWKNPNASLWLLSDDLCINNTTKVDTTNRFIPTLFINPICYVASNCPQNDPVGPHTLNFHLSLHCDNQLEGPFAYLRFSDILTGCVDPAVRIFYSKFSTAARGCLPQCIRPAFYCE